MSSERALASRVVRALGLGASPAEVDRAAEVGVRIWAEEAIKAASNASTARRPPALDPPRPPERGAGAAANQAWRKQLRQQQRTALTWWLDELVTTERPVLEKLTLGWHDHFATSVKKVGVASRMLEQVGTLRAHAVGRFDDLATAMADDSAMLVWLDAVQSTKAAPNENFARELMELFCLGAGRGYSEADVKAAARALTGWRSTLHTRQATYDPDRHDDRPVTLFGTTRSYSPKEAVAAVLARPEVSGHVATRVWHRVVSDADPSPDDLARAVEALGPDRDLAALTVHLVSSPAFEAAAGSRVTTPLEWAIGAARAVGLPPGTARTEMLARHLERLGQVPLYPPSVAGWPRGTAWLSTSGLSQRVETAAMIARSGDLGPVQRSSRSTRVEAAVRLIGLDSVGPQTRHHLDTMIDDPRALVAAALVCPENLVV